MTETEQPLAKARHDLRNPVSHILGFAEMLLEEHPGEVDSMAKGLRALLEVGQRLIGLINHHLDAANIVGGHSDLTLFESELRAGANQVLQILEELSRTPAASLESVRQDLQRIAGAARQVLELAVPTMALLRAPGFLESLKPPVLPCPTSAVASTGSLSKPRILLVDDLAELRQQLLTRLTALGYVVTAHANAAAALQFLAANTVDAILLDLGMPGVDGLEALKQLKSSPTTKTIPVLMLTFAEPADKLARCLELGAAGFLAKPCNDLLLQARLQAALGQAR